MSGSHWRAHLSDLEFQLGQRWVSHTEPELGLGIIAGEENRRVTISFPAAAETRVYASDNAPINRVQYHVGDDITDSEDRIVTVIEVINQQDYLIYVAVDKNGNEYTVPELELNSFVQFSRPQDRLYSGQIDKLNQYQLRYQSLRFQEIQHHSTVRGLTGARVQLLPHQLHIANEVANRFAPRVLLADEVGLGKTIEAGLIVHHQLQTGRARRVLVCVPDSLVHQWLVELLRRFNLQFTILDEERCEAFSENDENPFESTQLVLSSIDFFIKHPDRQKQASDASWDLLIVDEAHHLEWTDDKETVAGKKYRCVEDLAQSSTGLLLLTATPEQLGEESHFARLRLLDPSRYFDFEKYKQEEKGYLPANELVQELLADDADKKLGSNNGLLDRLATFIGAANIVQLKDAVQNNSESVSEEINRCVQHLLDHHGTGRVLFRNTRNAVMGFPKRELIRHPLSAPNNFSELANSAKFEECLRPENLLGPEWLQSDPRVTWLVDWLKQHRREKVLLICNQHETTLALEEYLSLRKGVRSAAFHHELSLIERDRAAAYFADDIDGAQLLVCSEIGSEGRNFQFAHHLVLFDLPYNPDLLEQRIGRLARIGQQNDVQIHIPFYECSAQEKLLDWYHKGINAIEESCPAAQLLFSEFKPQLDELLFIGDDRAWSTLLATTQKKTQALLKQLAEGRDRLLELNSCNLSSATKLITAIEASETESGLPGYMSMAFDVFGVDDDHHSANTIVLHPSDHMQQQHFPGLPDEGLTATYDRKVALSREDIVFLSWEHPMVRGVMDMVLSSETGNTSIGTMKLPPLKPGTLLVETIFVVHCPGPQHLQLDSYFTANTLRVLSDEKTDLTAIISFAQLNKLQTPVPNKKTANGIIRHAKEKITQIIAGNKERAEEQREAIVSAAENTMREKLTSEMTRLKTLAEVNPNIRQEEIVHIEDTIKELSQYISQTQVSLDAVRVIVCT